jgi:trans-AT polyketide synthase, acyltransferase and oxidoreductase domains
MKVVIFPGQGSQRKGMGSELFKEFPNLVAAANKILGFSVEEYCLNDPDGKLSQTRYTQPCLFVVSALSFLAQNDNSGQTTAYFAGHSLGEFNALFAAESFDFETGVELVNRRALLMSEAKGGGMAAIINCPEQTLRSIIADHGNQVDIANLNSPNQIVISGPTAGIDQLSADIKKAGATLIPLKVSAAFHSRYMQSAKDQYATYLQRVDLASPRTPVISNVTGHPHRTETLREDLARQIASSVRWTESIGYLLQKGCTEFQELGPGNVLTKLVTAIRKSPPQVAPTPQIKSPDLSPNQERRPESHAPSASSPPTKPTHTKVQLQAEDLGSPSFRSAYGARLAYVSGSMYKGIASKELVVRMGKAGLLSYFGTGGLRMAAIEEAIRYIQSQLKPGAPFGMNLIHNIVKPQLERETVDLFLRYGIQHIEASAFMQVTSSLVYYKAKGLRRIQGEVQSQHRILAKVSRPEVAQVFLSPPTERVIQPLLATGDITEEQAELLASRPVADDLCVEADSAGHTDMGVASVLIPTIIRERDRQKREHGYRQHVHVGAAGGIGTPESAAAAFILGAEFVLTGSINQCTVESGMSAPVKDMLQSINVQDTAYAPAGDMFELGAKVQVLKRGVFFPARANKLYDLWQRYQRLEDIDEKTRAQIEQKFFGRSFEEVYRETSEYYRREDPGTLEKAEKSPKHKMALIFRWYFIHSMRLALKGELDKRVDFQVHCGPALGAFNQWVKDTPLESWKARHVDQIGLKLMEETAALLNQRFKDLQRK